MDPNATVEVLVAAIENGDRLGAAIAAQDLAEWIRKGGMMPNLKRHTLDFLLSTLADQLRR